MAAISKIRLVGEVDFFDTFEDEQIQYTRKAKDFKKLDVSYGDYSNSFTLPASKKNNRLFKYYYDVKNTDTFVPYLKNATELYVNNERYSSGALSLISINVKNGVPQDYKVQYFADTINLKEALKDAKLNSLGWGEYNHNLSKLALGIALTGGVIYNLNGVATNLKYPLWSAQNRLIWGWGNSPSNQSPYEGLRAIENDVSAQGLLNQETRPMIPVSSVMDKIFENAGFNYEVDFAGQSYYDDLHMWVNNGAEFKPVQTPYASVKQRTASIVDTDNKIVIFDQEEIDEANIVNPINGEITIQTNGMEYNFTVTSSALDYTFAGITPQFRFKRDSGGVVTYSPWTTPDATVPVTTSFGAGVYLVSGDIITMEYGRGASGENYYVDDVSLAIEGGNLTGVDNVSVSSYMPNMKAIDFVKSLLVAFNAVIYWDELLDKFIITHTKAWYENGNTYDITNTVDASNITISPPTFYKNFSLKFKETDAVNNKLYQTSTNKIYGSSLYPTGSFFGDPYDNECGFTAPSCTELLERNIDNSIAYSSNVPSFFGVDQSYKQVDTGVVLAYYNGTRTLSNDYKIVDTTGGASIALSACNVFLPYNSANEGFLFNSEFTFENGSNTVVDTNLFTEFYQDYVSFIYDPTVRRYKATAYLPYNLVKSIKVNDNVTISGLNYLIEDMKINLTTLRVDFNLIINKL